MASQSVRGWGLVELVFVMLMLSAVAVYAFPATGEILKRGWIGEEARRLERGMVDTFQRALLEQRDLVLELYPTSYRVVTAFNRGEVVPERRLRRGISIDADSQGRQLRFTADGVVTPATVVLRLNEHRCELVIALRGRIRRRCW